MPRPRRSARGVGARDPGAALAAARAQVAAARERARRARAELARALAAYRKLSAPPRADQPGLFDDATPLGPAVDPAAHMDWARGIARGVRRDHRFGADSQEEADLEAVAYLTLCECAARFDAARVPPGGDAGGLFRGWCAIQVRANCRREAVRLRNGGTFHRAKSPAAFAVRVGGLGELELPDRDRDEGDGDGWSVCVTDADE